jgi:glycyl-tRNA synthetase beta chain
MNDLLLEIGTEEIPAGYIEPALKALSSNLLQKLSDARIGHGRVTTYGTPKRLCVKVEDVADKQKSQKTEITGPPEKVGFDEDGSPTMAAIKFAEKLGASVKKIQIVETKKGKYLSLV